MDELDPLVESVEVLDGVAMVSSLNSAAFSCARVAWGIWWDAWSFEGVGLVIFFMIGSRDLSDPKEDFDRRRGDSTGPEAERGHTRFCPDFLVIAFSSSASLSHPRALRWV